MNKWFLLHGYPLFALARFVGMIAKWLVPSRANRSIQLFAMAICTFIIGLTGSGNATQYPWAWQPLGVGCARAISVGPNGAPWILGCSQGQPNGVGPAWVYYLNTSYPAGSLLPHYQWVYDNFSALTIYVNLNGEPFVTGTDQNVYMEHSVDTQGAGGLILPTGNWWKVAEGPVSSIAITASDLFYNVEAGEVFYPWIPYALFVGTPDASVSIWGINCVDNCYNGMNKPDSSIWDTVSTYVDGEPNEALTWLELPGSATTVTMFTLPEGTAINGSDVEQVPWVLNAEGNVYWWSATDNDDTQYGEQGSWKRVATPESIKSITDGAILGQSGILYECATGNIFDAFCASGQASTPQQWTAMAGPYLEGNPNNPINIKQIALGGSISEAVVGGNPNSRINSPTVWAIDYSGNIYYSAQYQIAQ